MPQVKKNKKVIKENRNNMTTKVDLKGDNFLVEVVMEDMDRLI